MGNYNRYFVASESDWEQEKEEHDKVDDGLDVLIQLDGIIDRAFDLLNSDQYGNMSRYTYDSIAERINKCKEKNNKITNYANGIYGVLEDKENDFHKQLSRAMESLSKLDIEDYEVDNTLNIEEWHTISTSTYHGTNAYNQSQAVTTTTYKTKKGKITFSDIQAKTDMFQLQDQFANYLKENGKDGKHVSEAEADKLKKQFYSQALSTSFDHTVYNDGWWATLSTTLDYIPLVGGLKSIVEGFVGTTMTGEQLSANERLQYALMGAVSAAVDVFTFGTATAAVQGTKAVVKEGVKIIAKDVLTGWSLKVGSQALANMDLPPQLAFMAHIGLNIAISRSNIKKAKVTGGISKTGGVDRTIDDLIKQTRLTSNQLDDIMKYTGKNADELLGLLKKGDLLDIIQGRNIDFIEVNVNNYDELVSKGLKPSNSPTIESWKRMHGNIEINADGSLWKYTDIDGNFVYYRDGFPDFYQYKHPDIAPVTIRISKPKNNSADFRAANEAAGLGPNTSPSVTNMSRPPEGYTWHHMEDGETMILINSDMHADFKHIGGQSLINGKGGK